LATVVEQRTTWGVEYRVCDLADEFAERLREELDFEIEARNASDIAANLDGASDVRIPAVFHDLTTRRVLVMEWLDGVSVRDADLLRQAVLQVATLRRDVDDEELERALSRFMTRHLAPGMVPSAAMFNDLLQLFFTFGINLPPELSTFFRALITLEGTLTTLSPGYPVIDRAEAIVTEWVRARLAPSTLEELAREELIRMGPLLRRLPRRLDRMANQIERGNFRARVSLFSDPHDEHVVTKLVNRTVLAVTGGVVGLIGAILLGVKGGPPFAGDTTLYEFFGYFSLY